MASLRNKRKLAAVSRETPESTRNGRTQNILDPELTQDYISQVSEEIEGRVTKKLSKEFSRTESRILGALSKLDEFLLNPQVRTCSVVAPGTSRSNNFENQGTNEDRPSDDPGPEVEFASPISGAETNPHSAQRKQTTNSLLFVLCTLSVFFSFLCSPVSVVVVRVNSLTEIRKFAITTAWRRAITFRPYQR